MGIPKALFVVRNAQRCPNAELLPLDRAPGHPPGRLTGHLAGHLAISPIGHELIGTNLL